MPNIAVGDTMLMTVNSVANGQRVMNTFVYVASTAPAGTSDVSALSALHTKFIASGGLISLLRSVAPVDQNFISAWYQIIRPTRYRKVQRPIAGSGLYTSDMLTSNIQASISRFGDFATRRDQGGIRLLVGTDGNSIENGYVSEPLKLLLDGVANELSLNQSTVAPAVTWIPQVGLPADGAPTRRCTLAIAQDTVRVLRRRTVGLGI